MTTERPIDTPESEASELDLASALAKSYLTTYQKRRRSSSDGRLFPSGETSALAALVCAEAGMIAHSLAVRRGLLDSLQAIAASPGSTDPEGPGADLIGLAWITGYGTLPIEAPPIPVIESVIDSMSERQARGLFGVAFRAMFLTAADPLVNHHRKRKLNVELERRLVYLIERCTGILDGSKPGLAYHETARLAYHAAWLERHGRLMFRGGEQLSALLLQQAVASAGLSETAGRASLAALPSVHIAQLMIASSLVGDGELTRQLWAVLFAERLDIARQLMAADRDDPQRYELSPWIPLGVVAAARALAQEPR